MQFPYRLDFALDLFELTIDGQAVAMSEEELDCARTAIDAVKACWPEPKPEQLWAAIADALGRDPRS